jgi:hypothetical protein
VTADAGNTSQTVISERRQSHKKASLHAVGVRP